MPTQPSKRARKQSSSSFSEIAGADRFLAKLFEHPGAQEALDALSVHGMSRDTTIAFLRVIANSQRDSHGLTLPRPADLRRASARARSLADEIARINKNPHLNPAESLKFSANLQTYAHMFELLPGALSAYSQYLQVQAWLLADVGKTKLSMSKLLIIRMLQHTKDATGREHYEQIACLLTAVGYESGTSEVTEPGTLRMLLRRHRQAAKRPRYLDSVLRSVKPAVDVEKILAFIALPRVRKGFGHKLAVGTSSHQDHPAGAISER